MTEAQNEIIVELYKEFLDEENTQESCICCCHSFVDKDRFYKCGLGNFHVCCGGVNCKDFEISSFIQACFEKIKNLKAEIEKMKNKNKESDAVLAAGSTFNKALNSMNKALEEERDKYRNMVFDKDEQLTKAKDILRNVIRVTWGEGWNYSLDWKVNAEQYLKDLEK